MKIILIDDISLSSSSLLEELKSDGYEVSITTDIEVIKKDLQNSSISALVIDSSYEKSIEIFTKIRDFESQNDIHVPIIFSGKAEDSFEAIDVDKYGAIDFIVWDTAKEFVYKITSLLRPDKIWEGARIMLVEDEIITGKFLSHLLKVKGAEVKWFKHPAKAFEYIKENREVDLIITDFHMPELSGVELTKKVRKELGLSDIPIVFTSVTHDKKEIIDFFKSGGNDFISKPLIREEVYTKVKALLDTKEKNAILKKNIAQLKELSVLKDQFLAVCSHDLRAPLNTILGFSDVLIDDEDLSEEHKMMLEKINKAGNSLLSLVNDLLGLSELEMKMTKIQMEEVSLVSLINSVLEDNLKDNDKNIKYKVDCKFKDIFVSANKNMLTRAFTNLVTNSLKFTPNDGEIIVKLELDKDKKLQIILSDTGIGIPKDHIGIIFDKLSDAGRVGLSGEKSTGLGLSIVKEIIDKHQGQIRVESEENVGTSFIINLNYNGIKK